MRLILRTDLPVEEIAAEPETLQRFAAVLARARTSPTVDGLLLSGGRGLLGLPLIPDASVPPLTVLLRPHTDQMGHDRL